MKEDHFVHSFSIYFLSISDIDQANGSKEHGKRLITDRKRIRLQKRTRKKVWNFVSGNRTALSLRGYSISRQKWRKKIFGLQMIHWKEKWSMEPQPGSWRTSKYISIDFNGADKCGCKFFVQPHMGGFSHHFRQKLTKSLEKKLISPLRIAISRVRPVSLAQWSQKTFIKGGRFEPLPTWMTQSDNKIASIVGRNASAVISVNPEMKPNVSTMAAS